MTLNTIHRIYFIGIGGIGMSALARFFKEKGALVSGYDKTKTPLTEKLESEGIQIHYTEDLNAIDKNADIVVYTPAIPATQQELIWYQDNHFEVVKRSDILQAISNEMQAICVAGTHGKTTISTLIAHILKHSQYGCNAFLGGISTNYGVNYWSSTNACAVIEADEYDRSFLKLNPYISVLTAMDADHLDIYGTAEEMEKCYIQYVAQIKNTLVYKHGLARSKELKAPHKVSYSLQNDAATFCAADIQMHNGTYTFSICKETNIVAHIQLNIGGMHNVENTVAAFAVCHLLGIETKAIEEAVADFKGVKRRFEYVLKSNNVVYIDDYAHHPEELKMLLSSAKSLFKGKKLGVIFQPHLFTRTRDFCDGFADSLDIADEIILLDIYPARELPIVGVTSNIILDKLHTSSKHILSKAAVLDWVAATDCEVVITAGAGDIDNLIEPIKTILAKR